MYSILDNKIGSYSPDSFYSINLNSKRVGLKKIDDYLYYSICQDGICIAYRKDVAKELLDFFNFVYQNVELNTFKYGWGIDVIAAAICIDKGLFMIKDECVAIINKSSCGYFESFIAQDELNKLLELFINFKGESIRPLINKILSIVRDNSYSFENTNNLTLEDFYE